MSTPPSSFSYPWEPENLHPPKQNTTFLVNYPGLCQAAIQLAREKGRPRSVVGARILASILQYYEIPKFHLRRNDCTSSKLNATIAFQFKTQKQAQQMQLQHRFLQPSKP